jgi:hypothetical protein
MGKGARRRSRASGAGGGGHGSKRPRRAEEEEQEEEEMEPLVGEEEEVAALEGEDYCFVCKDGGDLRVCDFRFAPLPLRRAPVLPSSHLMIPHEQHALGFGNLQVGRISV